MFRHWLREVCASTDIVGDFGVIRKQKKPPLQNVAPLDGVRGGAMRLRRFSAPRYGSWWIGAAVISWAAFPGQPWAMGFISIGLY